LGTGALRTEDSRIGKKEILLALQHLIAMFGATVLVPILTGLNVSVALFTAGAGTLVFHLVTKGKAPVFLGSSFAFIAPVVLVAEQWGLPYATGGIIAAGLVYVVVAAIIAITGPGFIRRLFPPVVTGPVITIIGLTLAPIAKDMAAQNWVVALFTIAVTVVAMTFMRGYFRLLPILTGVVSGYIFAAVMGLVDFSGITAAGWIAVPDFMAPAFSWAAIGLVAPLAIVTMIEHIGDMEANGAVIGKDLIKDPGLQRTLLGDGLATALAGLCGGPANTTYSENTGVLAVTKVYKPAILRITAVFAILLAFLGKFGALISSIPSPVMGGISIILFGMIAAVGLRQLVEHRVDLKLGRNQLIVATILVFGISGAELPIGANLKLVGMSLGAVVGVLLNLLLPRQAADKDEIIK